MADSLLKQKLDAQRASGEPYSEVEAVIEVLLEALGQGQEE
jgi:hypothetical protein